MQLPNYGMFEERKIFKPGDEFHVFKIGTLTAGILICREILFPMLAYLYFVQKTDLLIGISNSPQRGIGKDGVSSFQLWETMGYVFSQFYHQNYLFVNRVGFEDGIGFGGGSFFARAGLGICQKAKYVDEDVLDAEIRPGRRAPRPPEPPTTCATSSRSWCSRKCKGYSMLKIRCDLVETILVGFIRDSIRKNGFKNAIVGVSGGLDSAVVLALCRKALGRPPHLRPAPPLPRLRARKPEHGKLACARFKVPYEVIDISPSVDAYFDRFPAAHPLQIGNKCARESACPCSTIFRCAKKRWWPAPPTRASSWSATRPSSAIRPPPSCPSATSTRPRCSSWPATWASPRRSSPRSRRPTCGPGRPTRARSASRYEDLDIILHLMIDRRWDEGEIVERGFPLPLIRRIKNMIVDSQFKRTMPPVIKLHPRTVGIDFGI